MVAVPCRAANGKRSPCKLTTCSRSVSYQTDIAADEFLAQNGHKELCIHPREADPEKRKSGFRPFTEAAGQALINERHDPAYWNLPPNPPRHNGLHYFPEPPRKPFDLSDEEFAQILEQARRTAEHDLSRDMLSWALRVVDLVIETRAGDRLSGRQVAIAVLSGHPQFVNKSLREIGRETRLVAEGISTAIRQVSDELFQGAEDVTGDLFLKSDAAVLKLSAGRIAYLRSLNHAVRSIPRNLERGLRHFARMHPERREAIEQAFPELLPASASPAS